MWSRATDAVWLNYPVLFDEILERMGGAYEFTDVFFKRWLRREFVRLITQTA